MNEAIIHVNDVITSSAFDFYGYSFGVSAQTLRQQLEKILISIGQFDSVRVLINSPGGDPLEGEAIHGYLRSLNVPVTTEVIGICASAATLVSLAGDKGRRKMSALSSYMIHRPSGGNFGTSEVLRGTADWLDQYGQKYADFYADQTGLDSADVMQMMTEETWLDASSAKNMGFIDEIVGKKDSVSAQARLAEFQSSRFEIAMNAAVFKSRPTPGKSPENRSTSPANTSPANTSPAKKITNQINQIDMSKEKSKGKGGFASFLKSMGELLSAHSDDAKKMLVLNTVEGVELSFDTEAENPLTGDKVTKDDGTAPENGKYELQSGGTVTIEGGLVSAFDVPESVSSMTAARANAAKMTAEFELLKTQNQAFEASISALTKSLEAERQESRTFKTQMVKLLQGLQSAQIADDDDDAEDGRGQVAKPNTNPLLVRNKKQNAE